MQTDGDKSSITGWTKRHVDEVFKEILAKKKGKLIDFGEYLETKALKTARMSELEIPLKEERSYSSLNRTNTS